MIRTKIAVGAGLSSLAFGCMTVSETNVPEAELTHLPEGCEVRVQLEGFEATVTTYETAYAYTTAVRHDPPWCGWRGWGWGGPGVSTYSTTEFLPRSEQTPVYRDRATDLLERGGCVLKSTRPQYRVEVHFDGPFSESGDGWAAAGWSLLTLLTADYGAQDWTARLRVYDVASGKLVFGRDLAQRDQAVVWGPIPIFSPSFSDRTSDRVLKHRCLLALTDLLVSDVLRFFATAPAAPRQ